MTAGWQALAKDDRQIWSVRTSEWKLIKYTSQKGDYRGLELFDLKNDPGERHNAAAEHPEIIQSLQPKLEAYISRAMTYERKG